jgi:hypothetical protein
MLKRQSYLPSAPLDALNGLTAAKASALKQALGISTIGDRAGNRFVHVAQTITGRVA